MPSDRDTLLTTLHNSPHQVVVAVTGGGSRAVSDLLTVPGASRTLLSASVPYSVEALQDFVREWGEQVPCNQATARRMAVEAFEIALDLAEPETPVHGIACTASLASDRPKRGPHRIHAAAQSAQRTAACSLTLEKGARSRAEEEAVAASLVLDVTLRAAGIQASLTEVLLRPGEEIQSTMQVAPPEWPPMGSDVAWRAGMPQQSDSPTDPPKLIFPGSFNPLHDGHRQMAAAAERLTGHQVTYEISVENVDKPQLDFIEIAQRVSQFEDRNILVTRAPTFVEKAALLPGGTFIVGVDTLIRIADEAYYDDNPSARDEAISQLADAGCRLLVFGRAFEDLFLTLDDLALPPALESLCTGVSESEFRADVSSTEIRESE